MSKGNNNYLNIKIMEANYFIVVNEGKSEVYYVTESQARAQHFTKRIYAKYDKNVSCRKVRLSERELKAYDAVVSRKK